MVELVLVGVDALRVAAVFVGATFLYLGCILFSFGTQLEVDVSRVNAF